MVSLMMPGPPLMLKKGVPGGRSVRVCGHLDGKHGSRPGRPCGDPPDLVGDGPVVGSSLRVAKWL